MLLKYNKIDVNKVPISVIVSNCNFSNKPFIYNSEVSKFDNLDDLLSYFYCSSYIPFVTDKTFSTIYKNKNYIDGGFYNKFENKKDTLLISRHTWGRKFNYFNYLTLTKESSKKLFQLGWSDTEKNKDKLNKILEI